MATDRRSRAPRLPALCALALGWGGCAAPAGTPARQDAVAVLQASSEHYAALQHVADSLAALEAPGSTAPSERSRATAGNLADRIASLRGDFEAVTVAMTTSELERTESLWMRMALGHAALDLLYVDARNLAADPLASPAELRELAAQLGGALELARASSGLALARLHSPPSPPPPPPARSTAAAL